MTHKPPRGKVAQLNWWDKRAKDIMESHAKKVAKEKYPHGMLRAEATGRMIDFGKHAYKIMREGQGVLTVPKFDEMMLGILRGMELHLELTWKHPPSGTIRVLKGRQLGASTLPFPIVVPPSNLPAIFVDEWDATPLQDETPNP